MATVNRPPFWVPSGDQQDTVWQGQLATSRRSIAPLLVSPKMFGAPGEALGRKYSPLLTYDDSPYWVGSPLNSGAIEVTNTQLQVFGQHGQGPTPRWWPTYSNDEWPQWQGAPSASWQIPFLTMVRVYGQGGQAPPFRTNWGYDDSSYWVGTPTGFNRLANTPTQNPLTQFRVFWYSEDSYWQGSPAPSAIIPALSFPKMFGQGGQAQPFRANFTQDDPPQYQGSPRGSAIIPQLAQQKIFGQGGQSVAARWWPQYAQDDPPPYQPPLEYLNSNILNFLTNVTFFGQGGQAPPFRPSFTYDDPPQWQGAPIGINVELRPPPPGINPFSNRQIYWYSEDSEWLGRPVDSAPLQILTSQKIFRQGGQVAPFKANLTYDDFPVWPAGPIPSPLAALITLEVVANVTSAQTPFYVPRPGDESYWQYYGTPLTILRFLTQSKVYGAAGQTPPFRWNATYDDLAFWQGSPTARNLELAPPSGGVNPFSNLPIMWMGIEHETYWLGTPTPAATQFALSSSAFSLASFDTYEHESFWQGAPVPANVGLTATPVVFPSATAWRWAGYNYNVDTPEFQGSPRSAVTLQRLVVLTQFNNAWRWIPFTYDVDAPGFSGSPTPAFTLQQLINPKQFGQPGQTIAYAWAKSYTQDDASHWIPTIYPDLILTQTKVANPNTLYALWQWQNHYDIDAPGWQGTPLGSMYLLTNPIAPKNIKIDWINFYRRGRRRS